MNKIVIKASNIYKSYSSRINQSTIRDNFTSLFQKKRKEEFPFFALQDISFDIEKGDVIGLIGKNGSGKSTLLKLISKIIYPTSGKIEVEGTVSSLLELGSGFHLELSGRENIYFYGSLLGLSKQSISKKFDEIVSFSGVKNFIDLPIKYYSSGMTLRLGFSVISILDSDIVLLDEVFTVGDFEFKAKSLNRIEQIIKSGRTIIIASHNMEIIKNYCDKGILLENGQIRAFDTSKNILSDYLKKEVLNQSNLKHQGFEISDFFCKSFDGKIKTTFKVGEILNIKFRFYYEIDKIENFVTRLEFIDELGKIVFICNSWMSEGEWKDIKRSGSINCCIPKLPLNIGHYTINLGVRINRNRIFSFNSILKIIIEKGNFFRTGILPSRNEGVLVDHSWSYES